jgi:CHAD domain-containing protein
MSEAVTIGVTRMAFDVAAVDLRRVTRALGSLPAADIATRLTVALSADDPRRDGLDAALPVTFSLQRFSLRGGPGTIFPVLAEVVSRATPTYTDGTLALQVSDGDPACLHRIAQALVDQRVPLALIHGSAEQRRCRAAAGYPAAKAMRINEEARPDAGQLVRACIDHLAANRPAVLGESSVEGVHQTRVAMRRLRSLLPLVRRLLPVDLGQRITRDARALAATLGAARDLDVLLAESVPPVRAALADLPGFERFVATAEAERERCRRLARRAMTSERLSQLAIDLAFAAVLLDRTGEAGTASAARHRLGRLIDRRHDRLVGIGNALSALSDEARHDVRKDLKKLRYLIEFSEPFWGTGRARRAIGQLAELQEVLGHMNDAATVRGLAARIATLCREQGERVERVEGALIGWYAHAAQRALASIDQAWAKALALRLPG